MRRYQSIVISPKNHFTMIEQRLQTLRKKRCICSSCMILEKNEKKSRFSWCKRFFQSEPIWLSWNENVSQIPIQFNEFELSLNWGCKRSRIANEGGRIEQNSRNTGFIRNEPEWRQAHADYFGGGICVTFLSGIILCPFWDLLVLTVIFAIEIHNVVMHLWPEIACYSAKPR